MDKFWILVAHQSRALILTKNRIRDRLMLHQEIEHPRGRLRDRELGTDRPGRTFSTVGNRRHGLTAPTLPHEQDAVDFTIQLASFLDRECSRNSFQNLILVAGPDMMGRLRSRLHKSTSNRVVAEITKNLGNLETRDIDLHIGPEIRDLSRSLRLAS